MTQEEIDKLLKSTATLSTAFVNQRVTILDHEVRDTLAQFRRRIDAIEAKVETALSLIAKSEDSVSGARRCYTELRNEVASIKDALTVSVDNNEGSEG